MIEKQFKAFLKSPVGPIEIMGTAEYITSVNFVEEEREDIEHLPGIVEMCKKELQEYFEGKRTIFSVAVRPDGTVFQQKVWNELLKIAYGETVTYGHIAKALNDENASRAVGHANGKNPIAIIIPCHRVIGESGKLTGYAGGPERKGWLLALEGNVSGKNPSLF